MISQQQIDLIIAIMKPYKPKKIGIFGSFARGENSENSDLDILYDYDGKITLFDHIRIINELKTGLKKEVDLVTTNALHPLLKDQILKDLKIIYES